ncbi:hypothetical protein DL762_000162 [Monosporascus cannonballus]|uniref:Uncharacterized protein n=1 Tax=Monosporascus cannonballus TaxID=155416 RepID=A0ABY0HNV4_9PEZI|nr:hypothetical protein DL762_000162 [Monosporascus cannonballus]
MDELSRTQSCTSSDHNEMENSSTSPPREDSVKTVQAEEEVQEVDKYPDGGPMAWLAVAGATACLFVPFGWVNVIGIFQEYY